MKVFISWSGVASRALAEALAEWFPKVIQGVQPFVSAKDIDKGSNWTTELARELADTEFGVLCLTPDNLVSPWLNYEAGAIAKSVESRVCPVLLGVEKAAVRPPISQLQMTAIERDDIEMLMTSMNKAAGGRLTPAALHEAVEVWWPLLEKAVNGIAVPAGPATPDEVQEPAKPETSPQEMLTELLHRVRQMDSRLRRVEPMTRRGSSRESIKRQVTEEVYGRLLRIGLTPERGSITESGVEIHLVEPLPEPLPRLLFDEVGEIAKSFGIEVRLQAPDRTVTFDTSGFADEPPF